MGLVSKGPKKKLKARPGGGGGGGKRDNSDLRPSYVPKTPPCMNDCPNHNDIRGALTYVAQSEMYERSYEDSIKTAFGMLAKTNPFPGVCGRVCPHPCEGRCNRQAVDKPMSINAFERFLGDYAIENGLELQKMPVDLGKGEKIAVVGAGPSGLSAAYQMARRGYAVTVFEAFPKAGGMLRYGIPNYRLPEKVLDTEIERIAKLGVDIKLNTVVGKDVSMEDLRKDYKAVYVGIGAHVGRGLRVEGEEAPNVMSGAEFLHMINSGDPVEIGDKVLVVGGGNTAIDAARVSRRLGADVTVVYRRTVEEMPAIEEEIKDAEDEGIKFEFLAAPVAFEKDGDRATAMKCIRMELGEPDDSGRRRPVPIDGSEFTIKTTFVIPAISQEPDFTNMGDLREGRDWIKIDEFGRTKLEMVFAGGDDIELWLVTGAIAQGRFAAEAMDKMIQGGEPVTPEKLTEVLYTTKFTEEGKGHQMYLPHFEAKERADVKHIPVEDRFGDDPLNKEVVPQGLTLEQVIEESKRCISCGMCFRCGNCYNYCQDSAIVRPMEIDKPYYFKLDLCQGCKKCAENCPCGYIDMN